nr:hypothetical protein [uncultured Oscillibacter sp.]
MLVIALSIIDLYSSHRPLARDYPVKYTDAWCSTFASAVAIQAGLTSIFCDWQDSGVGDNTGAAEKITKAGPRSSTPENGIGSLVEAGVINTPEYWAEHYRDYPSPGALLCALGGADK